MSLRLTLVIKSLSVLCVNEMQPKRDDAGNEVLFSCELLGVKELNIAQRVHKFTSNKPDYFPSFD